MKILDLDLALFYNSPSGMAFPDGVVDSFPSSMIYINARLVEIHTEACNPGSNIGINQELAMNDIGRVVQYLNIQVSVSRNDGDVNDYLSPVTECVRSLITNIPRRKLGIYCYLGWCPVDLANISGVPPLAHIHIMGWKDDWVFELIRRCVGTLQVLELDNILAGVSKHEIIAYWHRCE